MSTPIKDGGPAAFGGLSLRDHFAAQALAGQLAAESEEYGFVDELVHPENELIKVYGNKAVCHKITGGNGKDKPFTYDYSVILQPVLKRTAEQIYAERSYKMADAMLAARERKEGA